MLALQKQRIRALKSFATVALLYLSIILFLLYFLYPQMYLLKHGAVISLSLFALWRYGWMLLNYIRAFIYHRFIYPKLRKEIRKLPAHKRHPKHLFFIIPSYQEEAWVTQMTFDALMHEIATIPSQVTVVVATSGPKEDKLIHTVCTTHPVQKRVRLIFQHQNAGKRIAMGHALRAIARIYHKEVFDDPDSVTVFMDGDTYMPRGFLKQLLPFFATDQKLGAVTTNEMAYIHTKNPWYRDWFNLKFGQRHILFQAHSLSKRVMTLTGRLSAYRSSIVIKEDFIRQIEHDIIVHPLHGKFRFLMGDDKSTWYYLLKSGWHMRYLPDLVCISLESRDGNFLELSRSLPYRWFGNTLRNNARALALGPRHVGGHYIWYTILEQRLIMWTSLVGISSALILSATISWYYLLFFAVWVIFIRLIQLFIIALSGHVVSWRMVPLILYTQWIGALVKIRAFYHLSDQKWSKNNQQQQNNDQRTHIRHPMVGKIEKIAMYTSIGTFVLGLLFVHGVVQFPGHLVDQTIMVLQQNIAPPSLFAKGIQTQNNTQLINLRAKGIVPGQKKIAERINALIAESDPSRRVVILFEAGRYDLYHPIRIGRSHVVLQGSGKGQTQLISHLKYPENAVIVIAGRRLHRLGYLEKNLYQNQTLIWCKTDKKVTPFLLIRQPNDSQFLTNLGSKYWHRKYPYLRQEIVAVADNDTNEGKIYLKKPVLTDFAAVVSEVIALDMVEDVTVSDLTIRQLHPSKSAPDPHCYENSAPEVAVDALLLYYCASVTLRNLALIHSGRHAINSDYTYGLVLTNLDIDGSWNKGKRGNGYLRLARTYYASLGHSRIRNIRHLTLQWSSAGNYLHDLNLSVDLNLHGGFSHANRIGRIRFTMPFRHPWSAIEVCPNDAKWAPPDGKNMIDFETVKIIKEREYNE